MSLINIYDTQFTIIDSYFNENFASAGGAAIYIQEHHLPSEIRNCTFLKNSVDLTKSGQGGAIYSILRDSDSLII